VVKIKICGLFREEDIDYANEASPDYIGFVFAESRRQVSFAFAAALRKKLKEDIIPVGVFVNAPVEKIAALYRDGVIDIAQLHGDEDSEYITTLKNLTLSDSRGAIKVIKTIKSEESNQRFVEERREEGGVEPKVRWNEDYLLFDSSHGTGKAFDWNVLNGFDKMSIPWFLAGGIGLDNIEEALRLNPFGIDISSGAETDGVKDRSKMIQLSEIAHGQ
jgi:phosphoribosylanthranilate isomerase